MRWEVFVKGDFTGVGEGDLRMGDGDDSETDGRRRKHTSETIGGARLSQTSGIKDSNNY